MSKTLKIGHWIPAYNEQINANVCAQLLMDSVACAQAGNNYRFWSGHSCSLVWMRNDALNRALNIGLDYLLMQDADVFSRRPGGALMPMLGTATETNATVVSALVTMRTIPPRGNAWPCNPGCVYTADKVGAGMILINLNKVRRWYEDFDRPCFAEDLGPIGADKRVGMDIYFSYVVREMDGDDAIVVDGRIPTTHINACHREEYDGQNIPDLAGNQEANGA
jgi:hypothetical protein